MEKEQGLLPGYFKFIGGFISLLCLLYALAHHFIEPNFYFEGLRTPNLIFCFGLILIISSKERIEDEYANQIRLYAHSLTSIFFITFIFIDEIQGEKYSFLSELTGLLLIYILIFYYSFKKGIGWIKKPGFKEYFVGIIIGIVLLVSQEILWTP
ncbi:MAG TPA: hypothetical protein DD671_03935 [Balneolaceae bacterium]|nr:hypothetical protein [Balneola sp.]HBQ58780.1 hypothetical protein [Balneolaceae bacterium]|tara:strand:+ start:102684 stop:103145 length:462 start_codon:yes stop_codon:yes gene_type:complete